MVKEGGTDLHLHEGQPPRYRIHGSLIAMPGSSPLDQTEIQEMLQEIASPEKWELFEETGDLDFAYAFQEIARFRVNYQKHYNGYGAVCRTIPSKILSLEELKTPEVLRTFAKFSSGLCLITGPTGSGKTTTLAAILDYINSTQKRVIVTIEEPIEYVHKPKMSTIIQREVGTDVNTFGDGLRAALRQDAEVVLVGEMRDLETIALAVTAAEMGLLVFGTLHTNSATKTIDRIIDVFPVEEQDAIRESLSVALRAVCAQLLLKRKDGQGRVAAHEVMIQTRAVSNLIREGNTSNLNQVIMSNRAMGMQLMDDTLQNLFNSGAVSGTEAYMKAHEKERFKQFAPSLQETAAVH
jgi:twitching motility protein PilT